MTLIEEGKETPGEDFRSDSNLATGSGQQSTKKTIDMNVDLNLPLFVPKAKNNFEQRSKSILVGSSPH